MSISLPFSSSSFLFLFFSLLHIPISLLSSKKLSNSLVNMYFMYCTNSPVSGSISYVFFLCVVLFILLMCLSLLWQQYLKRDETKNSHIRNRFRIGQYQRSEGPAAECHGAVLEGQRWQSKTSVSQNLWLIRYSPIIALLSRFRRDIPMRFFTYCFHQKTTPGLMRHA
jgi:hypothetical protein